MRHSDSLHLDASPLSIGLAVSAYHPEITRSMLAGAVDEFIRVGGARERLRIVEAAGAWELTAICRALAGRSLPARLEPLDSIVAIGCILTGETTHDAYIAQSVTQGLTEITVETGVPITFGVLTCQTMEQARARAGLVRSDENKGVEAMRAAIATAIAIRSLGERV